MIYEHFRNNDKLFAQTHIHRRISSQKEIPFAADYPSNMLRRINATLSCWSECSNCPSLVVLGLAINYVVREIHLS
jgi:hypothetical protein